MNHPVWDEIEFIEKDPSLCAKDLRDGSADLGLIPIAVLPTFPFGTIVSDIGICAAGPVKSVAVFSEVPLRELSEIYLDHRSRTSVNLLKSLLKHFSFSPVLKDSEPGFEEKVKGSTGALVIGDSALTLMGKHKFCFDLAEAWMEWTALPFVFAAWVTNTVLPPKFLKHFNDALQTGVSAIPGLRVHNIISQSQYQYLTENIRFQIGNDEKKGLARFFAESGHPNFQPVWEH